MPIRFPAEDNSLHINNLLGSFTGRTIDKKDIEKYRLGEFGAEEIPPEVQMKIIDRPMCWCDLFYMAAVESTRDKTILVTRYPIDSCYNQFPSKINIASTHETEPMFINNTFYKFYPKITKEDIGTNSSNKFIDTLSMSNIYLGSIGGDYDGDQVNAKSIFSIEANKELSDQINSKRHYISLSGKNIMETTNEGAMVLYSLTATVDDNKVFTDPEF